MLKVAMTSLRSPSQCLGRHDSAQISSNPSRCLDTRYITPPSDKTKLPRSIINDEPRQLRPLVKHRSD